MADLCYAVTVTRSPSSALGGVFRRVLPGLLAGSALTAAAMAPAHAEACSCRPGRGPHEAQRTADAVFEGRVYGQTKIGPTARFSFQVVRYWKGDLPERVDVDTPASSAACGRTYDVGRTYVVYAQRSGQQWIDNMCSRTRTRGAAASDLAMLGRGTLPGKTGAAEPAATRPADPAEIPREPPRVEPVDAAPRPATPSARGCSIDANRPVRRSVTGIALLLLVLAGRRRSGLARATFPTPW